MGRDRVSRCCFASTLLVLLSLSTAATAQTLEPPAPTGVVRGQVLDGSTRDPLGGTTVTLIWPTAPGETEARQEMKISDPTGWFEFTDVPPGTYRIRFTKPGFRDSTMTDLVVVAGQDNLADFPLPPLPTGVSDPAPDVEEFVVVASPLEEILEASRMESDQLLNTMSAAEISKFAASDVADALRFVPGVNVVEGQFAIIRGLEDRYSSTLFNSAPVPSPDPDRQSVQLDLFPSDIVTNLVIAKTFGAELPSNSSGGAINVLTEEYPENTELKLSFGSGFNEVARDRFIKLQDGLAVGEEADPADVIEDEFGSSIAGRREFGQRELRFKALYTQEVDFDGKEGFQESRQPRSRRATGLANPTELVSGQLGLSEGLFQFSESERADQKTAYLGLGIDLDGQGDHRLDIASFYTSKDEEAVQLFEEGYLPREDYGLHAVVYPDPSPFTTSVAGSTITGRGPDGSVANGPIWFSNFSESKSFERDRDLLVYQLNGDHQIASLEGLHLRWASNYARTTQQDSSLGLEYFYEPFDVDTAPSAALIPTTPDELNPGGYFANLGYLSSRNDIDEGQWFARFDGDYELQLTEPVVLTLNGGLWLEDADRDVNSAFLEAPGSGGSSQVAMTCGSARCSNPIDTNAAVNSQLQRQADGDFAGTRLTTNDSSREIDAWNAGGKLTLWEDVDLLAGLRRESILIESNNEPFVGENAPDGSPRIYPSKYLFFDRPDNQARNEFRPTGLRVFNDEILGIRVPIDPVTGFVDLTDRAAIESLINGKIDERRALPAYGLSYRPLEGMSVRLAYSETVARPSFREMAYYVSVEQGSDDKVVGNPQLQLSDVESWDARAEYSWGDFGDLAAVSVFKKDIEKPIESIVLRAQDDFSATAAGQFRTFFNNPNDAEVRGIELEGRKNLAFLGPAILEYFSVGGNYTYIKAEVDRTQAEIARSVSFFQTAGTLAQYPELEETRRLYGQPEWIGNVDLSFDQPEWGTKITLALYMISDILDAAGSAAVGQDGTVSTYTLDRYVDSYNQLDLILSQTWNIDMLGGDIVFKANVKNLTDSTRRIIYDPYQTSQDIPEREYQIGQDYSFSVGYKVDF